MDGTKSINSFSQSDASNLIRALERETEAEIVKVRIQNEERMKEIEQSYNDSIGETARRISEEYTSKLNDEQRKIINRGEIEKIKTALISREEFIDKMINEVISELRSRYREEYIKYLTDGISEVTASTNDSLELLCHSIDAETVNAVITDLRKTSANVKIKLKEDLSVTQGGVLINSLDSPVVFNLTIERMVHRKKQDIRNRISSIVHDGGRNG